MVRFSESDWPRVGTSVQEGSILLLLGFQVVACGTCVIVTNDSAMGPTVVVIVSWQVTISYLAFELSDFVVFIFDGLIEIGNGICEHFKGFAIGGSGSSKVDKGSLSV